MSDQVQVEITGMVITHRYGSLQSGTTLRTDAAYAKHLVEDCGAARYIKPMAAENSVDEVVIKSEKPKPKKANAAPVADGAVEKPPVEVSK